MMRLRRARCGPPQGVLQPRSQVQTEGGALSLRPLVYHLRDCPLGLSGHAGTADVLASMRVYSLFGGVSRDARWTSERWRIAGIEAYAATRIALHEARGPAYGKPAAILLPR